jgi:hypothetical protein
MTEFDKIAVINVGWSDDYQGSPVVGAFRYLKEGVGHERYNFRPGPDGRYFGYAPPLGERRNPPAPKETDGWLVFVVSKRPTGAGLYLVGWYEDAEFLCAYAPRPDADDLGLDPEGEPYGHTLVAPKAFVVPPVFRTRSVSGDHLKRSYAYLRGNGLKDPWRRELATKLLGFRDQYLARDYVDAAVVSPAPTAGITADATRRKEVEDKSVEAVKRHFTGWNCKDRQKDKCGYDLLFRHRISGREVHVEVKGTQATQPHFFISFNELRYAENAAGSGGSRRTEEAPTWQLAMVTDALGPKPTVTLYDLPQMKKMFLLETYTWHATVKN